MQCVIIPVLPNPILVITSKIPFLVSTTYYCVKLSYYYIKLTIKIMIMRQMLD